MADYFERNRAWTVPGDHAYNTQLDPSQESQFMSWVQQNKVPFDPQSPVTDYDMRGFWKALMSNDPRAQSAVNPNDGQIHYPDYWKTPYHETFSAESQWANPAKAPRWNELDQLVTPDGSVVYDERQVNMKKLMEMQDEQMKLMQTLSSPKGRR